MAVAGSYSNTSGAVRMDSAVANTKAAAVVGADYWDCTKTVGVDVAGRWRGTKTGAPDQLGCTKLAWEGH